MNSACNLCNSASAEHLSHFFHGLKVNDIAHSPDNGEVTVIMKEKRDNTLFLTCETNDADDPITFDAICGELYPPQN